MNVGEERIYNNFFKEGKVILWDVISISNEQVIFVEFLDKNSQYRQGIRLGLDIGSGCIEVNGYQAKSIELWEDSAPRKVLCKCHSTSGKISIYNIWDEGKGKQSQAYTSGMKLEEEKDKLIYYCNDFGFETEFNKLVFSIQLLNNM